MQKNVDSNEIRKFEEIAHRWWDTGSEFKPLHDINPLRLNYIEKKSKGLANKKIIDIGCGGGILSESMAIRDADVIGIDMGKTPLSVAKLHSLETNANLEKNLKLDYQQITAEDMAEKKATQFDIITCMEMLEHVPDPFSIIQSCANLVKTKGHVFFSTINRNPKSFLFAIIGAEYILRMLPKGTHEYAKFIRPSELETWARQAGLRLCDITGMSYNPLFDSYHLGQNVSVNYIMHFMKDV